MSELVCFRKVSTIFVITFPAVEFDEKKRIWSKPTSHNTIRTNESHVLAARENAKRIGFLCCDVSKCKIIQFFIHTTYNLQTFKIPVLSHLFDSTSTFVCAFNEEKQRRKKDLHQQYKAHSTSRYTMCIGLCVWLCKALTMCLLSFFSSTFYFFFSCSVFLVSRMNCIFENRADKKSTNDRRIQEINRIYLFGNVYIEILQVTLSFDTHQKI